jgi:subtilase family serine protease
MVLLSCIKKINMAARKTDKKLKKWLLAGLILLIAALLATAFWPRQPKKLKSIDEFKAQPFSTVYPLATPTGQSSGFSPNAIKAAYHLGGLQSKKTIAIVNAYDHPRAEADLAAFSKKFNLRRCTKANGCFKKHKMARSIGVSNIWAIETSLDVQWAHAISPHAKILLVEARSNSGIDLLAAVNYARKQKNVAAISMSWGGTEFADEANYEHYFTSKKGATFFAASGDTGNGVSWPAVSANVIAVGGTTLRMSGKTLISEEAWTGSGGGITDLITAPGRQNTYGIPEASGMRAVPDVSYNADPDPGFPVYSSVKYSGNTGWFAVGGTSAGAPQWAAMRSSSSKIKGAKLYQLAKQPGYFRDITTGSNGGCGAICSAIANYDFVTGLGSPNHLLH